MKAIINGKILLPDGVVSGKALLFDRAVTGLSDTVPADCETIDAQGLYVSPGFVDVHIHGYLGEDASDGSLDGLRRMARGILQNGVTSFLPTTMTVALEELTRAFETIRAFMAESAQPDFDGARALGCHAEGPFINPAKKGAQAGSAILSPDASRLLPWRDTLRLVTLAPEMPGGMDCVRALLAAGIAVSIGHTNANGDTCYAALEAGADHFTHTFNAMSPLTHRGVGAAGAALASDAYAELIADGFHVDARLFPLMRRAKGERLVLITDCTRAGGMQDGQYTLGGQPIFVHGVECRLADGTIAGSVLRMNDAVRNYCVHGGAPLYQAVHCAALTPARSIGMQARKGSLEAGKDADILLIDKDMRVHAVWTDGQRRL